MQKRTRHDMLFVLSIVILSVGVVTPLYYL